jgi:hypothetical protein
VAMGWGRTGAVASERRGAGGSKKDQVLTLLRRPPNCGDERPNSIDGAEALPKHALRPPERRASKARELRVGP